MYSASPSALESKDDGWCHDRSSICPLEQMVSGDACVHSQDVSRVAPSEPRGSLYRQLTSSWRGPEGVRQKRMLQCGACSSISISKANPASPTDSRRSSNSYASCGVMVRAWLSQLVQGSYLTSGMGGILVSVVRPISSVGVVKVAHFPCLPPAFCAPASPLCR